MTGIACRLPLQNKNAEESASVIRGRHMCPKPTINP